ncbi:hypothetical protein ASE23_13455 [Rhizobium sp. Root73]|nr:hypothetical protein ASC96_26270 [Rhizobium sp. Root1204]KQY02590.1 hypothetical protein ASD36_15655 [Rhizobium sp. Root1334]KRB99206.1 hypothetical protein ASE23_13455 [Rhizobium sp. Root73]
MAVSFLAQPCVSDVNFWCSADDIRGQSAEIPDDLLSQRMPLFPGTGSGVHHQGSGIFAAQQDAARERRQRPCGNLELPAPLARAGNRVTIQGGCLGR